MAPKASRSGNLSVAAACTLSLAERRALRGIGPAGTSTGPPAAAAVVPSVRPSSNASSSSKRNARALGRAASAPAGSAFPATRVAATAVPLRSDMPVIKHARRGGVDAAMKASESLGMEFLVDDLHQDREAASGRGVRSSHLATWTKFHVKAIGVDGDLKRTPVLPLTPDKLVPVAALFKAGDYRSFANYLSSMKSFHLDHGHPWNEFLEHVGCWTTRSVLRGIGPARQSQPIPLPLVMKLSSQVEPCVKGGPTHPREAYLLGSVFLLGEVELSATRLEHLVFTDEPTVTWTLSGSKTDPMAFGVTRTLGCMCGHTSLPCPYHLAPMTVSLSRYSMMDRAALLPRRAWSPPTSTSLSSAACSYARRKVLVYLGVTLPEWLVRKLLLQQELRSPKSVSSPDIRAMLSFAMSPKHRFYR